MRGTKAKQDDRSLRGTASLLVKKYREQEKSSEQSERERCFENLRRGRRHAAPHIPAELACHSSDRDRYPKRGTGEYASPAGGRISKAVEGMRQFTKGRIVA